MSMWNEFKLYTSSVDNYLVFFNQGFRISSLNHPYILVSNILVTLCLQMAQGKVYRELRGKYPFQNNTNMTNMQQVTPCLSKFQYLCSRKDTHPSTWSVAGGPGNRRVLQACCYHPFLAACFWTSRSTGVSLGAALTPPYTEGRLTECDFTEKFLEQVTSGAVENRDWNSL